MTPWEKPVPHHKWADELEAEAKSKSDLRKAKQAAKDEDHRKECPYCRWIPVYESPLHPGLAPDDPDNLMWVDCYHCPRCERTYRVNCPGTILLGGNPVVAQGSGQEESWETVDKDFVK